jgi:hypothetical protein
MSLRQGCRPAHAAQNQLRPWKARAKNIVRRIALRIADIHGVPCPISIPFYHDISSSW